MAGRRWRALLATTVALAALTAACTGGGGDDPPRPSRPAKPTVLTLGVYGEAPEIAAYRSMVDSYNAQAEATEVKLQSWPDRDAIIDALEAGQAAGRKPPDLFLISRRDLARVEEADLNQPLFDLLDERGVSYGDRYSRDAVESFSADDDLQCMPYSVSPMVIYYNTDLIDFERMRERDLPVPDEPAEGWIVRGVPRRGRVRHPAPARQPRRPHRAHAAQPGAVRVVGRRVALRRRAPTRRRSPSARTTTAMPSPPRSRCCATRGSRSPTASSRRPPRWSGSPAASSG